MLADLAADVRLRRRSARSLVERALLRIEQLNGSLNAVVALRAEAALVEAEALDARVAAGGAAATPDLPLAGLPFLVKDVEDLEGLPTTHGSLLFADAPASRTDSRVVGCSARRARSRSARRTRRSSRSKGSRRTGCSAGR